MLLAAGCGTMPAPEAVPRPPRTDIAAYSIDGRVAVRRGEERHSANIAWRHGVQTDRILLTTPLGQGVAEIDRDRDGARLTTAEGEVVAAPDWEELSTRVFGFALPLSGLPRWLLADVVPARRDAGGRPAAAWAAGWNIRYLGYESDAADALPTLMEFRRDDIELRLKVDAWQLD